MSGDIYSQEDSRVHNENTKLRAVLREAVVMLDRETYKSSTRCIYCKNLDCHRGCPLAKVFKEAAALGVTLLDPLKAIEELKDIDDDSDPESGGSIRA